MASRSGPPGTGRPRPVVNQTTRSEENRPVVTMPKGNQSSATSQASSSLLPSAVQEQPHVQQPGRGQPLENQAFHPMMMMPPQPHIGYYAWPGAGVGQGFQAPAGPYYPERYFFQEKGHNVPFSPAQFSGGWGGGRTPSTKWAVIVPAWRSTFLLQLKREVRIFPQSNLKVNREPILSMTI